MNLKWTEEKIFLLILTGIGTMFVSVSLQLKNPDVAFVPLLISVPLLVGIVWQTLKAWLPALGRTTGAKSSGQRDDGEFTIDGGEQETPEERVRRFVFIGWIVLFTIITYFLGFLISTAVSMLFYFLVIARTSFVRAIVSAASMVAFIYVFFSLILQLDLGLPS